jgi:hypothetical protein
MEALYSSGRGRRTGGTVSYPTEGEHLMQEKRRFHFLFIYLFYLHIWLLCKQVIMCFSDY